ncbi:G1/S-specific cyclin CLN1 [Candida viswanathii]|uniref:G1/S-specific cyclin CLN1 n=1 Tax=Candida viswanathii TaxID=5486 RepID=A0A367XQD6_9ASCO|nr:G1/S-specific cyclin CLN1 [Candida viswanathii]
MNITRPLTPKSIGTSAYSKQQSSHSHHHKKPSMSTTTSTIKTFVQEKYPKQLYQSEIKIHNQSLAEYDLDIYDIMVDLIETSKPNLSLYKQQPYLTFTIRLKLIDFLLKMSIRLKILPFVFFKAVKIFDRYCSKRIVLLDQSQLIITTCLWIASKIIGGNNHFVNMNNLEKIGFNNFRTISDLGYGSGGKFVGPTERFRLPKLHELVKLCGAKCKYDQGMFKQMEVHVLNTLEWSLNDPSIEEFIVDSHEFNVLDDDEFDDDHIEFFKTKEYLSYVALYSHELIDINIIELGQVIMDLINEVFQLQPTDAKYQTILNCDSAHPIRFDIARYKNIKKALIKSIFNSSDFMLKVFNSRGPQYLYRQINLQYKFNHNNSNTNSTATTPISYNSRSSSVSSTSSNSTPRSSNTACTTAATTPTATTTTNSNLIATTPQKRSKNYSISSTVSLGVNSPAASNLSSASASGKKLHTSNHSQSSSSYQQPQMHSNFHSYQMVTPPPHHLGKTSSGNNSHHIPAPHQLSYSNSYFNSPNMQPPPIKYSDMVTNSANSKMTASSSASIISSISNTFENNDLFERRFITSSSSSSTISGNHHRNGSASGGAGAGTPLSENESPIYTKTRLCNMLQ